jgi:YbbR domain-containing protein
MIKPPRTLFNQLWTRYHEIIISIARQVVLFVIALLLALLVWIAATLDRDPIVLETIDVVPIRYANLDSDVLVVNQDEVPTTASIQVRLPESVSSNLDPDDIDVRADFEALTSGEHILVLEASLSLAGDVVNIEPSQIVVQLDRIGHKTVPVNITLADSPAFGFEAGAPQLEVETVTVLGPASMVEAVIEAYASLSVKDLNANLQRDNLRLVPQNQDGQTVEGVELDPATIAVTVPIRAREEFLTLSVQPDIRGQPPEGYNWRYEWEPQTITVTGRQPRLETMSDTVFTETISLWSQTESFEVTVGVILPTGITAVTEETITVRFTIEAIQESRKFDEVPVVPRGLLAAYHATITPETVTVWINGPAPIVDDLTQENVRALIDLSNLEPGTHDVLIEAVVEAENFVSDQIFLVPSEVRVQIIDTEATPTPPSTPTPTQTPPLVVEPFTITPTASPGATTTP